MGEDITGSEIDELDEFIAEQSDDPVFVAALEDAETRSRLLRRLVGIRHFLDIKQGDIADFMGNSQSTVSEFENGSADFLFSTIQKYARAVDSRLLVEVEVPAESAWSRSATREQFEFAPIEESTNVVDIRRVARRSDRTWIEEANRRDSQVVSTG